MQVREIMTQPAYSCRSNETMNAAAQLMWERDCGSVAVTDDDGVLVGMLTDRDVCMATYTQGKPPHEICVRDGMSRQVVRCSPDSSLEEAEQLMAGSQVRRLPVVDDGGALVGMVSLNDVARRVASNDAHSMDRAFVRTLSAICEPRPLARVAAE